MYTTRVAFVAGQVAAIGPQLLAFAYGHLGEHKLLGVQTDAHKPLVLAALNLVECIAYVGALPKSG